MANLIIKSSADNLVLQGSDASPAITVGATGTTTFAENATLSGTANNLGTISSATNFPTGMILQQKIINFNDVYAVATNVETEMALGSGPHITAKQADSIYVIQIDCGIVSYVTQTNPDQNDLGVMIKWGTSSGNETTHFGPSHAHRLGGSGNMNSNVNFFSTDAFGDSAHYGTYGSMPFSHSWGTALTVAAGQALYWKMFICAGSQTVYWNRPEETATANLSHTSVKITEIAV